MTIKKISVFIGILGILGVSIWQLKPKGNPNMKEIQIGNQSLQVEVADSPQKRVLGLGNRESLGHEGGMLFLFPSDDYHRIWMMGMKFPIDIIWLKDGVVVDTAEAVPPPKDGDLNLPTYSPKDKANQVLELNSGRVGELNLKIGDLVKIAD